MPQADSFMLSFSDAFFNENVDKTNKKQALKGIFINILKSLMRHFGETHEFCETAGVTP